KSICFTTTNGTRAMQVCRKAQRILLGAFVNLESLCQLLSGERGWDVVCAGTDGQITREDVLLAGALVAHFLLQVERGKAMPQKLNDQATIAADLWHWASSSSVRNEELTELLANSLGGRN